MPANDAPTVKKIVLAYLRDNGFGGLFNDVCGEHGGGCSAKTAEGFMPCEGFDLELCQAAHFVPCAECPDPCECRDTETGCWRPGINKTRYCPASWFQGQDAGRVPEWPDCAGPGRLWAECPSWAKRAACWERFAREGR